MYCQNTATTARRAPSRAPRACPTLTRLDGPRRCGNLLLQPVMEQLLARLFARGVITDDMPFDTGR